MISVGIQFQKGYHGPMPETLNGATRLLFIVGDPIAQVKSPAGVTQAYAARSRNTVCVPAHVAPADLAAWLDGTGRAQNVDGIIVTVPHKFAAFGLCATATPRAAFLGAANVLRRAADGRWHGDMVDGVGFVQALRQRGGAPADRRALLVGAGGAGSAIAHALLEAGVATLALHDADAARRDALLQRLAAVAPGRVRAGSADPAGFDIAVNATPMGMGAADPLPFDVTRLASACFVGCVVTAPAVPPLIEAARAAGCATLTGSDMFACVRDRMVEFLLGGA
jgi:shikimate dehydrogenase